MPLSIDADDALVEDHESAVDPPGTICSSGIAQIEQVGVYVCTDLIVTCAVHVAVPPAPVTVSVYVVLTLGVTVVDPFTATVPNAPKVADVALFEVHERTLAPPATTCVGLAERVHEGCVGGVFLIVTGALHVAVPPEPVTVRT
jgi:hypothetical protein